MSRPPHRPRNTNRSSVCSRQRDQVSGQYIQGSSSRSQISLANQRTRQKEYINRRKRMGKRMVCAFVRNVIIKDDGNIHWLPASTDGLVFQLLYELFKDLYGEGRRRNLAIVKVMYFNGDERNSKELPRIRIRDANLVESSNDSRIAAFVGWRFPFVVDGYEMDNVKTWLRKHQNMLRVSIGEAIDICVRTFSRYVKCSNKYLYYGYPSSSRTSMTRRPAAQAQDPEIVTDEVSRTATVVTSTSTGGQAERDHPEQLSQDPTQWRAKASRIMATAKDDSAYRSLKIALDPRCELQFSILCHVWISSFPDGKSREEWRPIDKDLFQYCMLRTQEKMETPEYRELQLYLKDQLEVLKLVRQSGGLPLYDAEDWPEVANSIIQASVNPQQL